MLPQGIGPGRELAMAEFTEWLAARRVSRIALIALLFPLLFPLLTVLSAAIIVFTTNLRGWRVASEDCVVAMLLLVASTALAGGYWIGIGIGAGITWAIAAALGHLRRVGSLTLAVQAAVLLGMIAALAFGLWNRDPQAYWENLLRDVLERAHTAGVDIGPAELVPGVAKVMTGVMAASAVVSYMGSLFLGSWLAGAAGGADFGQEFQSLRMGRVLGLAAGLLGVMLLSEWGGSADDLLIVLAMGFIAQGLSVAHWHGARRRWPKAWPLALYLPLLVPALAALEMVGLGALGLVDNGYSLRRIGSKLV